MGFLVEAVFLKDNDNIIHKGTKPYYYFADTSILMNCIKDLSIDKTKNAQLEKPPIVTITNNKPDIPSP